MPLTADDPWIRWDWLQNHLQLFADATVRHVELTAVAVLGGLLLAFPLAIAGWSNRLVRETVLAAAGVFYTIPSLALLAFLVPYTGLTFLTAEIALTGYAVLILVRNIIVGLDTVPADVRDAARGMGYRMLPQLLRVELPLAVPSILAGIRIATVTTIGLVTVTALIGEGGLGQLILRGLIQDFKTPLVVGTVLSIALAVAADVGLSGLTRVLTPWAVGRA